MSTEYDDERSVEENQARALFAIADAINGLLYGLKYSKAEGLSMAEAIHVSGKAIAEAVEMLARTGTEIAEAVDRIPGDATDPE